MNTLKHTLLSLLVLTLIVASCSKTTQAPSTRSILQQGKWKISLYSDNGSNETDFYSGYQFTFSSNGNVAVSTGSNSQTGTWSPGTDETQNKLSLNFLSLALVELNREWTFSEKSYSRVTLEHVSTGGGGTDVVVFEKL